MLYRVGDMVLVRNDLSRRGDYGRAGFVDGMAYLKGKISTITYADSDDTYKLVNGDGYWWSGEMLSKVITNEK